jgi:hypothetical protein
MSSAYESRAGEFTNPKSEARVLFLSTIVKRRRRVAKLAQRGIAGLVV